MKIQAITLADIKDASGRYLMIDQLKGNRPQERNSKVEWPTVGNIRKKYWKEWKNCVRETFCIRGKNKLKKKLGKWIRTTSQEWDTYIFRSSHNLIWRRIEAGQEKWCDHRRLEDRTLTYNVNKGREIKRPKKAVRVTLKSKSKNSWILRPGYTKSVATENKKAIK